MATEIGDAPPSASPARNRTTSSSVRLVANAVRSRKNSEHHAAEQKGAAWTDAIPHQSEAQRADRQAEQAGGEHRADHGSIDAQELDEFRRGEADRQQIVAVKEDHDSAHHENQNLGSVQSAHSR